MGTRMICVSVCGANAFMKIAPNVDTRAVIRALRFLCFSDLFLMIQNPSSPIGSSEIG
jgi:hypothetical protein